MTALLLSGTAAVARYVAGERVRHVDFDSKWNLDAVSGVPGATVDAWALARAELGIGRRLVHAGESQSWYVVLNSGAR
jgi:hypothetical protein